MRYNINLNSLGGEADGLVISEPVISRYCKKFLICYMDEKDNLATLADNRSQYDYLFDMQTLKEKAFFKNDFIKSISPKDLEILKFASEHFEFLRFHEPLPTIYEGYYHDGSSH